MTRSFIQFLLNEKRSHAAQNPKVSVNDHITTALKKAAKSKSRVGGIWNCFVSMTSIDKLGINPHSEYETPLGIYAYPAEYVHKQARDDRELAAVLPFAGELEHTNIFSARGNIINLGTITDVEVMALYKKIAAVYHKYNKGTWKKDMDNVEYAINSATTNAKVKSLPGGQLWYVTMSVSALMAENRSSPPVMWNKLFREIGVDGVIDMGTGIVHTNEPTQAVFFSIEAIGSVDRVANTYSPDAMAAGAAKGAQNKEAEAHYAGMSDKELINAMVTNGGSLIQFVKHPSLAVQQAAIEDSGHNIQWIRNPSEAMQLTAVENAGVAVRHIRNPSEKVQIAAVRASSTAIKVIKNPSEAVQIASVSRYPHTIGSIKNPSEAVQMAAVKVGLGAFRYIKHPTPAVLKYVQDNE